MEYPEKSLRQNAIPSVKNGKKEVVLATTILQYQIQHSRHLQADS
jgi:hypothetical protein